MNRVGWWDGKVAELVESERVRAARETLALLERKGHGETPMARFIRAYVESED